MQTVDKIIHQTIRHEGGYVNDPDDPGGATNWGITIGTLRRVRGSATVADVKALTYDEAFRIYKKYYFNRPKIDLLPGAMHATVFDMYVNAGGNAIKILQRLMRKLGENVSVDGALGPQTASAVARQYKKMRGKLVDAYGAERREYYFRIGDRRARSRKFAVRRDGGKGGWIVRAESFMSKKYHMSQTEFNQRISAWA